MMIDRCSQPARPRRSAALGSLAWSVLVVAGLAAPGTAQTVPGASATWTAEGPDARLRSDAPHPVQDSESPSIWVGAWLGAAAGAGIGLAFYEIGHRRIGICDTSAPNCTATPTRTQAMIGGAAVGALGGFLIAKWLASRRSSAPAATFLPSPDGGWSLGISVAPGF